MFDFEDPVVIDVATRAGVLSGVGSCGPGRALACSGALSGTIENRRAEFSFSVMSFGLVYASRVFVSEDATRMAGRFSTDAGTGLTTAWVRTAAPQTWLSEAYEDLNRDLQPYYGDTQLSLASGTGSTFEPGRAYALRLRPNGKLPLLSGDLGAFWAGEMTWDAAARTLRLGPVPATAPELPVSLRIDYANGPRLEAELANGERYTFDLASRP